MAYKYGACGVATRIRLAPRVADPEPHYNDLVNDVVGRLDELANMALAIGIRPDQIIVDAGLDLGKTSQQSLELLQATDRLCALGYPVLLSASNKTFLGDLLGLEVESRRDASLASAGVGVALGARILRVHDVIGTRRLCDGLTLILEALR